MEKLKPSFLADGNVKLGSHDGKESGKFFKKLNTNLPFNPEIPLLGIYLRKIKTYPPKDMYTNTESSMIRNTLELEIIQMFVYW